MIITYSSASTVRPARTIPSQSDPWKVVAQIALPAIAGVALLAAAAFGAMVYSPIVLPSIALVFFGIAAWRFYQCTNAAVSKNNMSSEDLSRCQDLTALIVDVPRPILTEDDLKEVSSLPEVSKSDDIILFSVTSPRGSKGKFVPPQEWKKIGRIASSRQTTVTYTVPIQS
jgi:hypothetical protein